MKRGGKEEGKRQRKGKGKDKWRNSGKIKTLSIACPWNFQIRLERMESLYLGETLKCTAKSLEYIM